MTMFTLVPIPSPARDAPENEVDIAKKRAVPPSAVSRIAVASQSVTLTTLIVRSDSGAPAARADSSEATGSRRSAVTAVSQRPREAVRSTAAVSTSTAVIESAPASRAAAIASLPAWPAPSTQTAPPAGVRSRVWLAAEQTSRTSSAFWSGRSSGSGAQNPRSKT